MMPTKKKKVRLPNKLSALLRLAVKDAKKVEKTRGYTLEMRDWHAQRDDGVCSVCMAGAVMAMSLKVPRCADLGASSPGFTQSQSDKFGAIDDMRTGNFDCAAAAIGRVLIGEDARALEGIVSETFNAHLGRAQWRTYLKAADELERLGL